MAHEPSLRDLLEERQIRSETIYQAVRYYLAERLHDPDPDDLLAQLATVMDDPDDACATLSRDALLLENAALLVLAQAWDDPAERERVRRAIDGATGKLPVIDPDLIALICLYGLYRVSRAQIVETIIRGRDGSLVMRRVVEYGPLAALLRISGNRAAPVPAGWPSEASRSIVWVDIQGSARVNAYQQAQRRDWLLNTMRDAVGRLRLRWEDLDPADRGDGVRLLVPEEGATLVDLVNGLPAHLEGPLREHVRMSGGLARLKVRMAIHAGLLRRSANGWDGAPLVHAARLVDAEAAKGLLEPADTGLALILSEWVFEQVVRSGFGRVKEQEYQQITVAVKETTTTAWVHLS
ncbi:MAG: hypothetical protein ACT4NY_30750 [Pseudonocardiales bacterium]